jgi:hypothetical protein
MTFEGLHGQEQSKEEIDPQTLNLIRKQIQMALAFSNLPMGRTHKEEEAIMIARIEKNSHKFNIVFDEMLKNDPNLVSEWEENSNELLAIIQKQMDMIPDLPKEEDEEHWKKINEENQKAA